MRNALQSFEAPKAMSHAMVAPAPYVTIALASIITGLTEKAIRRKIEEGKWIEGREFSRSPDGGVYVCIEGYSKWVEKVAA